MVDIQHTLSISAPAELVYRAVTEEAGLRGWWTRQARAEARVGHVNEFPFASGDFNAMRVSALEPGSRVVWECVDGAEEWLGTRVVFQLEPGDGTTVLRFSHAGWREDTPFFRMCRRGWEYYMASLRSYCESGRGRPSPLP